MLNDFQELVQLLVQKTSSGDIRWRLDAQSSYASDVNGYKITVQYVEDDIVDNKVIIRIINDDEEIDVFDDEDIEIKDRSGNLTYFPLMSSLYDMARRSASGSDRIVKGILDALR